MSLAQQRRSECQWRVGATGVPLSTPKFHRACSLHFAMGEHALAVSAADSQGKQI